MKKLIALVLGLMMVFTTAAALADDLTFTTGGTAGTYYAYGNVLAQYITNHSDVAVTAVAGNGSAANIDLLDLGDRTIEVVWVGGHTAGTVAFIDKARRIAQLNCGTKLLDFKAEKE